MNPSTLLKGPQIGCTKNKDTKQTNPPQGTNQNRDPEDIPRVDSFTSNCEHDETIFNEDFLNTDQLKYFNPPLNINSQKEGGYNQNVSSVFIDRAKNKIFDTGTVVQRYS